MADQATIKALLIQAAYAGAAAVCQPLINNPELDPLIQDVGLQNKDVLVYEVAKIHYAAILKAFADKTGIWPDPAVPAGVSSLNAVATVNNALQQILGQLPPSSTLTTVGALLQALSQIAGQAGQAPGSPTSLSH
jgi:hypothetical protein